MSAATDPTALAFLGGGHMARALIGGLLRDGWPASLIRVGEPGSEARAALQRDFGVSVTGDNAEAARGARLVVLAVKPQQALDALGAAHLAAGTTLLSIAAGVRIASLAHAGPGTEIVRSMPNRPALQGAGVTGVYAPETVSEASRALIERVLATAGRVVWLGREDELDVVVALSGSGPAYFFLLAEHLAGAARTLGLAPDTAELLATETLYGAGMLAHTGDGLAAERAAVTSKGGTTAAALAVFEREGLAALAEHALCAAAGRSRELAEQLDSVRQSTHPSD